MVWAGSAGWAERKVRTGLMDTLATSYDLENAPVLVRGEMFVKAATQAEVDEWHEAGGRQIEHWAG